MRCVGLVQNICRLKITKGTHYLNLKLAQRQLYLVVSPADLAAINCEAVIGKICKTWPSPVFRANVKFCRFCLFNHHIHPNKLHIFVNPTLHAIVYSLWAGVILLTQVLDGVRGEKGVSHRQLEIFSIFIFSQNCGIISPPSRPWTRSPNVPGQLTHPPPWLVNIVIINIFLLRYKIRLKIVTMVILSLISMAHLWGVLRLLVRFLASGSNELRPPEHQHQDDVLILIELSRWG